MNIFNTCLYGTPDTLSQPAMSQDYRPHTPVAVPPRVLKQTNSRQIIEHNDLLYDCPDSSQGSKNISGEVYVRRKSDNRLVFEGIFHNSEKNGFGIQYDAEGQVQYEGQFKNGMRDGWGRTRIYQGRFREGKYDGWGRLIVPEYFYEGYFMEGLFCGFGVLIASNDKLGNVDQLKNTQKVDDYILLMIEKQDKDFFERHNVEEAYIGEWSRGLKNGSGKLWRKDGYWYNGQFSYDMLHGNGVQLRDRSSAIEKGTFYKGEFHPK